MADELLLSSVYATRQHARRLRQATREGRGVAERTMARARRLRFRVNQLDSKVQQATVEVKRQRTLRDDALDALRQSLTDLESLRMTSRSEDYSISKLKAEIRKTLARR